MKLKLTIEIPDRELARLLGHAHAVEDDDNLPLPTIADINRICAAALTEDDDIPPPPVSPFADAPVPLPYAACPKCGSVFLYEEIRP